MHIHNVPGHIVQADRSGSCAQISAIAATHARDELVILQGGVLLLSSDPAVDLHLHGLATCSLRVWRIRAMYSRANLPAAHLQPLQRVAKTIRVNYTMIRGQCVSCQITITQRLGYVVHFLLVTKVLRGAKLWKECK